MRRHIRLLPLACCLLLMLTHCLSYDFSGRITQQGNLLPAAKVKRLRLGMSKQDVILLMGDSLLHDPFNPNQLDYAYTWSKAGQPSKLKSLTLRFQNDKLIHIERHP